MARINMPSGGERMERNWAAVARFTSACDADERVLAAFLGGSLASETADEQSDVDLYVVVQPTEYEGFLSDKVRFLRSWGEPVFSLEIRNFEDLGFDMVLFVMADGVDGELAIATEANLRATHGGPHRVLVDKSRILEGIEFPLLSFDEQPSATEVDTAIAWFWWDVRAALKSWSRGRLWEAARFIEEIRGRCLVLASAAGITDGRSPLAGTFAPLEPAALAGAIAEGVRCYLAWAPQAARSAGVTYPAGLVEVSTDRVARTLGVDLSSSP